MIIYTWKKLLCNLSFHKSLIISLIFIFRIAMTTHCASRYQKVLKQISPRICIVEEAAEVNITKTDRQKRKKQSFL